MNVEGRERFFRAIAERIDVDRVEEVHLFPAIRQGGRESGVAVLTLCPAPAESIDSENVDDEGIDITNVADEGIDVENVDDESVDVENVGDESIDVENVNDESIDSENVEREATPRAATPPHRFTVLRAHYRLQLKGPDRGKWEVGVVEEADAPAATVDEVVRGVHERAGGWSVEGPERLTGDEFRAALVEEPWSAAR